MPRKSRTETLRRFDGIFLKRISPPACSRLYSPEPMGVGAPMIESLTSYVARIASVHSVTVGSLVAKEIVPLINKNYLTDKSSRGMSTQFMSSARAMNGMGVTAADWVDAVQALTLRQELRFLTMLPLQNLISDNALLRKFRAWCPVCYEEWRQNEIPVYDPLLWSLDVVTVCAVHKRVLNTECVHCNKEYPALPRSSRPGFCSHCNRWMGVSTADILAKDSVVADGQLEWQTWVFYQLGAIFTGIRDLTSPLKKEAIVNLVNLCVQRLTRGSMKISISRVKSFSQSTLQSWLRGNKAPQLGRIMGLCYQAGVPFADGLLGRVGLKDASSEFASSLRGSYYLTSADVSKMEEALRAMLSEDPPPSLLEATKRVGGHALTIKKYFPELYELIRRNYLTFNIKRFDRERVKTSLSQAKKEIPPPSLSSVARRLGCSRAFLRLNFPKVCQVIVDQYAEYRKPFINIEKTRFELKELQKISPPLSIIQCAERLRTTRERLCKFFPEITHAIGKRYYKHSQRKAGQKRKRRQRIVRETAAILEAEGAIPSAQRIMKRSPNMTWLTNHEVNFVLQDEISRP